TVDPSPRAGPQRLVTAHDGGDQRRNATVRLLGGQTAQQSHLGGGEHAGILSDGTIPWGVHTYRESYSSRPRAIAVVTEEVRADTSSLQKILRRRVFTVASAMCR